MRMTAFEIILKSAFKIRKKIKLPEAVKKSAGMVEIPNKNIPNPAKIGEEMDAANKKAPYKRPQGIKPKIIPRK